jgi:hypothetical protein
VGEGEREAVAGGAVSDDRNDSLDSDVLSGHSYSKNPTTIATRMIENVHYFRVIIENEDELVERIVKRLRDELLKVKP